MVIVVFRVHLGSNGERKMMKSNLLSVLALILTLALAGCPEGSSIETDVAGQDTAEDIAGDAGIDTEPLPDAGVDTEPLPDTAPDTSDPDVAPDQIGPDAEDPDTVDPVCETDEECDDEDFCTTDSCIDGLCFNQGKDCDDDNECTIDGCDPETGQCTAEDVDCDDGNDCTVESCKPASGCEYIDIEDCCEADVVAEWGMEEDIEGLDIVNLGPEDSSDVAWTLSDAKAWSGDSSLYFGNPDAMNYDSGARVRGAATFPPAMVPEGVEAELRFFAYLDVEAPVFADVFTVYVVQEDGTRVPVAAKTSSTAFGEWEEWIVYLNAYAGEVVRVELYFDSFNGAENLGEGVFVDDLRIAGRCALPDPCIAPVDCNDLNPCTTDACTEGACVYEIDPLCCMFQAQCDDDDPCTIEECIEGSCQYVVTPNCCDSDDDCTDEDVCTTGKCTEGICFQIPSGEPGCCETDADCDDLDGCTVDSCDEGTCINLNVCCYEDAECDDGDDVCTIDSCVDGDCVYAPTGVEGCCLEVILDEDLEGPIPAWSFSPMNDGNVGWQVWDGGPDSNGNALYYGNILTENFDNGAQNSGEVISPEIWLQPGTDNVLAFDLYVDTEAGLTYDMFQVFVDWTGNDTWILVWDKSALVGLSTWGSYAVDLSGLAGETVRVRFLFDTSDSSVNDGLGVLVDNILVGSSCLPKECEADVDCADDVPGTIGTCVDALCVYEISEEPCQVAADCDDADQCTIDTCEIAFCEHTPAVDCCYELADCEDDNVCTTDACNMDNEPAPQCTHDWAPGCCVEDADCTDGNPCTADICPGEGDQCTNPWIDGCCLADPDCDDDDACTLDDCSDNECVNQYYCCDDDSDCDDGDDVCTNDTCIGGFCEFLPSGVAGCCEPLIYEEGFDGGLGAWTLEGGDADFYWQESTVQFQSGVSALYFGNAAADSYGNSQDATATSPEIELPSQPGLSVNFWIWFDSETNFDDLTVSVVLDDGSETVLAEFTGHDGQAWTEYDFDVSAFAGESIYVRFTMHSDSSVSGYPGFWVDSLTVTQFCCNEDADCDDDNLCTADSCPGAESLCINLWDPGCCLVDSDCDDDDPCTADDCAVPGGGCTYTNICCDTDADCDDGDDVCTNDTCIDGTCQFLPTGASGCCTPVLYENDFEQGIGDWDVQNSAPDIGWHLSTAKSFSGSSSLAYSNATGDSYGTSNDGSCLSPPLELPDQPGLGLQFQLWYEIESCCDDFNLSVVHDGGTTLIANYAGTDAADWQLVAFDAAAYKGETVQLLLEFSCDSSVSYDGVFIDDLKVTQDCCSEDSDCDDGNECTTDSCPGIDSLCINLWEVGCCLADSDCDDDDPCTVDECTGAGGECTHTNICCDGDADCDDGDDVCTDDVCIDGFCEFLPSGASGCCTPLLYENDFEGDLNDWVIENASPDFGWHLSTAKSFSGAQSLAYSNASGDSYGTSNDGTCLSPELELPDQPGLSLQFQLWYEVEGCCDDFDVSVVHPGGTTFIANYAGTDAADWQLVSFDATAYKGQTVQLLLAFDCDSSVSYDGVFIDDLKVTQDCCSEDADCDDGNACTTDTCPGIDSLCINLWQEGCCNLASDCDDDDPCTQDVCTDMACENIWICCVNDEDCDDGDDVCTDDACVDDYCVFTFNGTEGCCEAKPFEDLFDGQVGPWTFSPADNGVGWNVWDTPPSGDAPVLYYGNPDTGNFDSGAPNTGDATSPAIPLQVPGVGYSLAFDIFIDGETSTSYDRPFLYVSWQGPEGPWVEIWSKADYDTVEIATWQSFVLDISGLAGEIIHFRWTFETIDGLTNDGVGAMVDNFFVTSSCEAVPCDADPDCADDVPGTNGACAGNICGFVVSDELCAETAECDDNDACTLDACVSGVCDHVPAEDCCYEDGDCDDGNPCTVDACDLENTPAPVCLAPWTEECCLTAADCDDGELCTLDTCPGEGEMCTYPEIESCCLTDAECADDDICTEDYCLANACQNDYVCCVDDADCDDGDDLCTDDACVEGYCENVFTGADGCCIEPLFRDDFSSLSGWTLDQNWEIAPTSAGDPPQYGNPNPEFDHTATGDNSVMGVFVGGIEPGDTVYGPFYASSPVVDLTGATEPHVSLWRWLNSDFTPWMVNTIDVYDGAVWQNVWMTGAAPGIEDDAWVHMDFDVTDHANATFQLRIGYEVLSTASYAYTSWNVDDVQVYDAAAIAGDASLCCAYDSDCDGLYPGGAICSAGQCM